MLSNTTDRKLHTETLDEAMQEFMDVCKLYNDKIATTNKNKTQDTRRNGTLHETKPTMENNCFNNNNRLADRVISYNNFKANEGKSKLNCDINKHASVNKTELTADHVKQQSRHTSSMSPDDCSGSIEKLQHRQLELQKQLDKVLEVAKSLESKRKTKLSCILEDASIGQKSSQAGDEEEDDDELIEFQQIENELRVTELNRQLDNIQEELRMRLYKRLMINMTSSQQKNAPQQYRQQLTQDSVLNETNQQPSTVQMIARRDSQATDESTPPSSTCSDETRSTTTADRATSPASLRAHQSTNLNPTSNLSRTSSDISKSNEHSYSEASATDERSRESQSSSNKAVNNYNSAGDTEQTYEVIADTNKEPSSHNHRSDDETSGLPNLSAKHSLSAYRFDNPVEGPSQINGLPQPTYSEVYHGSPGFTPSYRNAAPVTSDLEKIEEGEEDSQDCYNEADRMRTIYEEKISPIIQGKGMSRNRISLVTSNVDNKKDMSGGGAYINQDHLPKQSPVQNMSPTKKSNTRQTTASSADGSFIATPISNGHGGAIRHDSNNSAVTRRKLNRPLTLYLPKPDDNELNLLEHVQALGHDPSILSEDLKITATSAQGYLRKSCANTDKKWLKRYFYFDRVAQKLSYYENEAQLVKKNSSPKNSIPFDDMSDVYVDHRLSILNCDLDQLGGSPSTKKGCKRGNVFVLATTKRRYLLATPKAETMRAWIDILFTAAKANDYFQDLQANDEYNNDKADDECC